MLGDKIPFLSGEAVERAVLDAAHSFSLLARDQRVMAWSLVWASLNWLLDAASLWCFVAAFGHLTNPIELFAAYGIANVAGALPITPGGLGVVDSIAPALLLGFGVPGGIATLGVLGWRVVNFWLPIPTGALAFVSLKVKPVSGKTTWRSAFAGLFAAGQPEEAEVTEVTEVSRGSGDPAEDGARERVPAPVVLPAEAPDEKTRAGTTGEDPEVEGEGDQARTTR
jgi:hypothetical protein